jgi:hypothetical protein
LRSYPRSRGSGTRGWAKKRHSDPGAAPQSATDARVRHCVSLRTAKPRGKRRDAAPAEKSKEVHLVD